MNRSIRPLDHTTTSTTTTATTPAPIPLSSSRRRSNITTLGTTHLLRTLLLLRKPLFLFLQLLLLLLLHSVSGLLLTDLGALVINTDGSKALDDKGDAVVVVGSLHSVAEVESVVQVQGADGAGGCLEAVAEAGGTCAAVCSAGSGTEKKLCCQFFPDSWDIAYVGMCICMWACLVRVLVVWGKFDLHVTVAAAGGALSDFLACDATVCWVGDGEGRG